MVAGRLEHGPGAGGPAAARQGRRTPPLRYGLAGAIAALLVGSGGPAGAASERDLPLVLELKDLSLQQLMNVDVFTATRQEESLLATPAAIYVVTRGDIRRSGVRSIPEALRLAPAVEVARRGASSWAISIRGFNGELSNKLLVLMDGRSVYSPLYAGVFWDVQDTLLEDVERIEVVAGPGGTLWGANAVNGVINIITRSAHDTLDGFAEIGAGNEERGFGGFRYGARLGEDLAARAYVKAFDRDASDRPEGGDAGDAWQKMQGGFRLDWTPDASDTVTLQGDAYAGRGDGVFRGDFTLGTLPGPAFEDQIHVSGGNVLGRWSRTLGEGSDLRLQMYYDRTRRDIPSTYRETRETVDVDFQHRFPLGERHEILWGAGFRWTRDEIDDTLFAAFDPDRRTDVTLSGFLQDRIDLWRDRVLLTLGSKFAHNDYTGFEVQPNARLAWLVSDRQTAWAAVSRAVRIPSRLDSDLRLTSPLAVPGIPFPVYVNVDGSEEFDSEKVIAYEAGYRLNAGDDLSFDLALFYNEYRDLQTAEPALPVLVTSPVYIQLPNTLSNGMHGESYGGTLVVTWRPVSRWRLQLHYTRFELALHNDPGSLDAAAQGIEGNSPEVQVALHSYLDLAPDLSLYAGVRYVDDLPNLDVRRYAVVDASLRWRAAKDVDLALTARNLMNAGHREFGPGNEIGRSVYATATLRF